MMEGVREHQVGDAHMGIGVADPPQRDDAHAVVGRLDLDLRARDARASAASSACRNRSSCRGTACRSPAFGSSSWKKRCRNEVCAGSMPTSSDCSQLQSIKPLNAKVCARRRDEAVEMRERRRLARAHVGEQDAALLHHRIGGLADVLAHPAAVGLGRRLQAAPGDVEQPAVEGAAQAAVLQPPEAEIGAAMRTGAPDAGRSGPCRPGTRRGPRRGGAPA